MVGATVVVVVVTVVVVVVVVVVDDEAGGEDGRGGVGLVVVLVVGTVPGDEPSVEGSEEPRVVSVCSVGVKRSPPSPASVPGSGVGVSAVSRCARTVEGDGVAGGPNSAVAAANPRPPTTTVRMTRRAHLLIQVSSNSSKKNAAPADVGSLYVVPAPSQNPHGRRWHRKDSHKNRNPGDRSDG